MGRRCGVASEKCCLRKNDLKAVIDRARIGWSLFLILGLLVLDELVFDVFFRSIVRQIPREAPGITNRGDSYTTLCCALFLGLGWPSFNNEVHVAVSC